MTQSEEIIKLKEALKVAANALNIASDWNVNSLNLEVPKEWNLEHDENEGEGWYRTNDIARKIKQLSN